MAALTADKTRVFYDAAPTCREYLMKANEEIFAGSLVVTDTNGLAVAGVDTAGHLWAGYADEYKLAGASGSYYIRVRNGECEGAAISITQAMVGDVMYVKDSGAFDDSAGTTNNVVCGVLTFYNSATLGRIDTTNTAILSTLATASVFADGSTLVHESALAATDVDGALEELHAEFDDHICESGAGSTTTSPGTNREHWAGSIAAIGAGVAYAVVDEGATCPAETIVRVSSLSTDRNKVQTATNTTGTRPGVFYCPTLIGAGAAGWVYKNYLDINTALDTSGSAVGNPVWRGIAGALTLTKPTGANRSQVVARVVTVDATGDINVSFDDYNDDTHEHTDESEGGEIGAYVNLYTNVTWTKDGTDKSVVTMPLVELPYAVTVKRCYASVDTAPGGGKTLTVDLNTTLVATVAAAATQAEDESLAIAIAADTDWDVVVNETAGGAGAGLSLAFYYTKDAV